MRISRILLVMVCTLTLLVSPSLAKPGGQGDADRDFSCADSCHVGESGGQSSATIIIELDRTRVFTGQTISISVKVSGMELSKKGLVGVFLMTPVSNGVGKSIEHSGWTVIQDPNGGSNNFVEKPVLSSSQGATFTWIVRAPSETGMVSIDAAIHHGIDPNPDEIAYQATSGQPLSLEIEPMPDDLPRISADWKPVSNRMIGELMTINLETEDAETVEVEWRVGESGSVQSAEVTQAASGTWSFTLPATTDEANLSWRAMMSNPALEETTPWFTLSSIEPGYDIDEVALFMQSLAFGLLVAAMAIALQRRLVSSSKSPELAKLVSTLPELEDSEPTTPDYGGEMS